MNLRKVTLRYLGWCPGIDSAARFIPERNIVGANHLRSGFQIALSKPILFVPALLKVLFDTLFLVITPSEGAIYPPFTYSWSLFALLGILNFVVVAFLNFVDIDMSRDAYLDAPLSLGGSSRYVLRRIGTFVAATLIGLFLMMTIVLIPVANLMFLIIVIEETGIGSSVSKALSVCRENLGTAIVLCILSIFSSWFLVYLPYIGRLVASAFGVVINLAFIDLYFNTKDQELTP